MSYNYPDDDEFEAWYQSQREPDWYPPPPTKTLYVFMDESGDMVFGPKGSQHFILSAVYTTDPCASSTAMHNVKYQQMAKGSDDYEFHATENSHGTRKVVADAIAQMKTISVHTLWIDKSFTAPSMQDPVRLFAMFGRAMGRWIGTVVATHHVQVVMVFDSVLTRKQQNAFNAAVKPELKKLNVPFRVLFHPVKSEANGQIADYFSWSWYRRLEAGDNEPCERLVGVPWSNFNLFRSGHTRYWRR
ncbi:DUF3800 domain-containing protein [Tsukamurella ocularis]|uniref:DUF3800 domain-containing protein n=1 Tax=Tsukamurella tyrosinosolvens TaxID=57704 RepID=UPI00346284EC